MQELDPRSVMIASTIVGLLFVVMFLALHKNFSNTIKGLREGTYAAGSLLLGTALISARDAIPSHLSILMGNGFWIAGLLLLYVSFRTFCLGAFRWKKLFILSILIFSSLLCAYVLLLKNYAHLLMLVSLSGALILANCMLVVFRMKPISFASGFTGFMFFSGALFCAIRFLSVAIGAETPTSLFGRFPIQKIYLISLVASLLGIYLGFIVMLYERLRKIVIDLNGSLESTVALRTASLRAEIERTKTLEREIASAAEAERRIIGSELHDDLGQRLTGISLAAEALARALRKASPSLSASAERIENDASAAISVVRRLVHGLLPVGPGSDAFQSAMEQLISSASSVSNVRCRFDYDDPIEIENHDIAINLFRIAQEALHNAIRHGRPSNILFRLDVIDGKLAFCVSDDGCGFDASTLNQTQSDGVAGNGIRSMRFRSSLINFRFQLDSSPGNGTRIKVIEC